ncbi:MAG: hypothetical protein K2M08_00525, partial [Anaeroplasmataceae bacterium]|nr:hypothetical protein [Anaeroplasmataceae bacterium]
MKKNIKTIGLGILCIVFALFISACTTKPHVHQYEEVWSKDERGHWYAAVCDDVTKADITIYPHQYGEWQEELPATEEKEGSKKRTCEACGYEETGIIEKLSHTHQYEEVWSKDERGHWYAAVCDDVTKA